MRDHSTTRRVRRMGGRLAVAVAVTSLAGTGIAYAYWESGGTGTGSAQTATMTISAAALSGESPNSTLFPGGTADAILKIQNPNGFPVQVVGITAGGTPQAGNGCSPTGVTFTSPATYTDPQFSLPANQTTVLHLAGAMSMSTSSASTCQGQTFSLPVTVTVRK